MSKDATKHNDIDVAWIRELAAILHETGLTEIEIEKSEVRLRISRAAAPTAVIAPAAAIPSSPAAAAVAERPEAKGAPIAGAVTSPMVGTVYVAPSPGAPAYVKQGDQVSEGQTLLIIEAMKTMNPVVAPRAGTVRQIFVRDAQPVEFGEPLIVVE